MTHSILVSFNALGWTLLHSLWQGAVIGLMFIVSRSVLGAASPSVRHANALVWLILLITLPVLTFIGLVLGATAGDPLLPAMPVSPWPAESPSLLPRFLSIAGCLWLSAVTVLSIRLFGEWRDLQHQTRIGSRRLPQLDDRFAVLKDAMNVRVKTGLIEAANATVPMVVGFLKPVIVLPGSALLGLTPRELELIIAHELAHLRRYDHLINYLLIAAETLLFYHPVVYALTRTIRYERELCCDDLVIGTFNERVCYAHALSKVEAMRGMGVKAEGGLRLAASDGPLVTRITRLVKNRTHRRWGVMPAAALPFIAATFAVAVFHQTHTGLNPASEKRTLTAELGEHRKGALSAALSATRASGSAYGLAPIELPEYTRRPVAASAISKITAALTQSGASQQQSATQRTAQPVLMSEHGYMNASVAPQSSLRKLITDKKLHAGDNSFDQSDSTSSLAHVAKQPLSNEFSPGGISAPVISKTQLAEMPVSHLELAATDAASSILDEPVTLSEVESVTVTGGQLVHRVTPRYPARARSRGFVDKVVVSIDVDETGRVNAVSVINRDSRAMFQRAVVRAVTQWEFEPLLRNGVPVERTVEQSFDFRLEPFSAKGHSRFCRGAKASGCRLTT